MRSELENVDKIINWIYENWISKEFFLENGFGICLIIGNTIVSWSLSENVFNDECEIGIETDDRFRRKGYGTITVSQAVNYCKSRGIKVVAWHCRNNNMGSYKIVEKLNFKKILTYSTYHAWFNSFDNYLVNGQYYLSETKDYKKSGQFYQKAFDMKEINAISVINSKIFSEIDNIKWCYYNAACSWALAGKSELAFTNLEKAVEEGWKNVKMLETDERLFSLRGNGKWNSLLTKITC
ncbi:hypothetical protein acsn021_37440 [Anaerocolumna cellulosilytica]|uniref:Uncharacterized protein n=1 Tax=Anaerocolumna cellulosilytica TaxID=433286 RepID=A0A6S6RAT6_9FIRM|nr:GNAT family N-acetyltransferase [Anaerocolumna cellulosilytica]MBB5194988.1 RimJ/RimL family protein N-acetyltransferase [Anaerocolumna cellulosilytica]BCJ96175.1 hypothetical protein acsn021_37440 [Anaerocolumna cellulosilytica]